MKTLGYSKNKLINTNTYLMFSRHGRGLVVPWWIWLAPLLVLSLLYVISGRGFIGELLLLSTLCATLPALLMALITWCLSRQQNFAYKVTNIGMIAIGYGVCVALTVYLLYGPYLSNLLLHTNPIDTFIFYFLFVVFSINLGLASVASMGLVYRKFHDLP